ncbi:enoyl-CoA hydratase/isomerase family protein [Aquincola sp. S2]|uniref:Enoyl-CoA hydratase/isomerase family protein n=1 Tax=Pseudaquabacterium terrae TaxID=2732868 RepID=A0ABX2EGP3_9BURK|nr:enoyl-CoA hydratase/isomerase family protein [Aquabacterium terrae]NRF67751.1 enoyl-CoA hydratase/isomerase family protein [Aquabacterium terrae]
MSLETEAPLLRELSDDGVLTLTLNRPRKLNAITATLAQDLWRALEHADADAAVKAVLLRGAGRAFCAGRDVSAAPTEAELEGVQRVAAAIVGCRKPVVAAVHGWVLGAGLEWMLDADIVIAARSARLKLPEASLGVFVTGGLVATLPAAAGLARAKALMLLGEEFSAEQALGWGLVWKLVDDDTLGTASRAIAQRLAALDADVAARYKRVLNQIGLASFEEALRRESAEQRALTQRTS